MMMSYGFYDMPPVGPLGIAATARGICYLGLGEEGVCLADMQRRFAGASLHRDSECMESWAGRAIAAWQGQQSIPPLDLSRGTAFQRTVWAALQEISFGDTRSYAAIARQIDRPSASRAVGQAVGADPVALLIPCHRVIAADGGPGGYHWGVGIKKKLLSIEQEPFRNVS